MDQLNLADDADQQNANDEQESQLVAQPPRNRGLLRKLSSAFQRKPMTRYDSFDGHRDSLDIVHRQVKEGNIAYRPRVPYPDKSVDNEKSSNSNDDIAEIAFQHPAAPAADDVSQTQPAGESTQGKRRKDKEEEKEEVRISDIASQHIASSVPQRLQVPVREDEGHQKISASSNSTPLPPQLQSDMVGVARSA